MVHHPAPTQDAPTKRPRRTHDRVPVTASVVPGTDPAAAITAILRMVARKDAATKRAERAA